jgi:hypothetical protein
MKNYTLIPLVTLMISISSNAYAADRVSSFTSSGSPSAHASTANQMIDVNIVDNVDCQRIVSNIASKEQEESIVQQTVVEQTMGSIDFNPIINCQKIANNAASRIATAGGSTGFITGVIAQIGANAACSYSPINKAIKTYNGYAKTAVDVVSTVDDATTAYKQGDTASVVKSGASVAKTTGVISSSTASTIKKGANAASQVNNGYTTGNVQQTAKGTETIMNTGSKYLTGAQ